MRSPSPLGWVLIALVAAAAVTAGRYYHRDANLKLRAQTTALNDRSLAVTAFKDRLPAHGNHLTWDVHAPATARETAVFLHLYHLLSLDGHERRLLFALLEDGRPDWAVDTVMRHLRWTMAARLRLELERGRYETVRLLGQRSINLVNAMPPSEHFATLDEALRTPRRVVQVITGRYLYDDEALARDVLRALIEDPSTISGLRAATAPPWVRDEIVYANARAKAAQAKRYADRRRIWEEFIADNPKSERRLEGSFNVIDATMNAYRDLPSGAAGRLVRAKALSREALALCHEFLRTYPQSYLTDDALRYVLRLAFSLGERDDMVDAYVRLARMSRPSDAFKRTQYGLAQWVIYQDKASAAEARAAAGWLAELARRLSVAPASTRDEISQSRFARLLGDAEPRNLMTKEARDILATVLSTWLKQRHAEEGVRSSWEPEPTKR